MTRHRDGAALPTLHEIERVAAPHGITHLGVASAEILESTRSVLHQRKADGLNDGMQFTYRNPDRSTDPARSVVDARSVIVAATCWRSNGISGISTLWAPAAMPE